MNEYDIKYGLYAELESIEHDLILAKSAMPEMTFDQIITNENQLTDQQKAENVNFRLHGATNTCYEILCKIVEKLYGEYGKDDD